jgi:hypothetical protein
MPVAPIRAFIQILVCPYSLGIRTPGSLKNRPCTNSLGQSGAYIKWDRCNLGSEIGDSNVVNGSGTRSMVHLVKNSIQVIGGGRALAPLEQCFGNRPMQFAGAQVR